MPEGAERPFALQRLKDDPALRTEVDYCAEHGIPHSEFLLRWTNVDRAKLVASLVLKSQRCQMCGTSPWEWLADPAAYHPMWQDCMGCRHKESFLTAEGEHKVAGRSTVMKSREEFERATLNPADAPQMPRLSKRSRKPRPKVDRAS